MVCRGTTRTVTVFASALNCPEPCIELTSNNSEPVGPLLATSPNARANGPIVTVALALSARFRLLGSGGLMTACSAALVCGASARQPTKGIIARANTPAQNAVYCV